MFAKFNNEKFPKVYITCNKNINVKSWEHFTKTWINYDSLKKPYTFIFDLSGLGMPPFSYAWKMTFFIEKLKKRKKRYNNVYLSKSIIICNNTYQKKILEWVFYIQNPVAPVYIVNNYNEANELYENLLISEHFYKSTVTAFFPKK
jgi:hypothetical protein